MYMYLKSFNSLLKPTVGSISRTNQLCALLKFKNDILRQWPQVELQTESHKYFKIKTFILKKIINQSNPVFKNLYHSDTNSDNSIKDRSALLHCQEMNIAAGLLWYSVVLHYCFLVTR